MKNKMLYCKKCEMWRGFIEGKIILTCCGCGLQIPIELEGGETKCKKMK
ncbi:hypothetical protein LCGC14_0687480 [marine sediment metagenome]|uniref:Uncharacterized protein n=1 Tax=marine sediment metagenome TaxID=412755 RepID=A0A0F9R6R4_9ZZZZ